MNTNFTKNPIVGTPLTPSVIKQIHTAVRRYMPIAGNGIRTSVTAGGTIISVIPAPAPKKQKDKPLPFEVRYDGTLDSGAGGWKIYLPTEHLVQFDGEYLDPLNGVTPILDENGDETGWYSFDEITLQDAHVWLVISESSGSGSSGAYTASFANAEDQQAVANICIAEVSYEAATQSTPETITIKQSVVGAIVMSSGGGGGVVPDDISTEFIPDPPQGQQPTGDEGKLQIKGWNEGTPVSDTTLAANLQAQYAVQGHVLFRDANGALKYKPIGQLSGGGHSFCGAFSYDPDTHTIKDGMYLRARRWIEVASATVSAAGYAYLQIGMGTSGTASIVTGASSIPTATNTYMYVPLYQFDEGLEITHDYRGAPTAQMWEF